MWSWLPSRRDDLFTRNVKFDRLGPFHFERDVAVRFQGGNGAHWLVLDSIYTGSRGATVHIVRPTDLVLGGGMDNSAENLAETVRQQDPAAAALFSYWPREPSPASQDRPPAIRRLTFERAPRGQTGPGGTYIIAPRSNEVLSHTRTGGPVRYQAATFFHLSFHELTQLLGTAVSLEPPAEVVARAEQVPGWAELATKVTSATQDSWDAFEAQLNEWNDD